MGRVDSDQKNALGNQVIRLAPEHHDIAQSFCVEIEQAWRRLHIRLIPGKFAIALLKEMSDVDEAGRSAFVAVMNDCKQRGAALHVTMNGIPTSHEDPRLWETQWSRFQLEMSVNPIDIGSGDAKADRDLAKSWIARFITAVAALLPLEPATDDASTFDGFPEGTVMTVKVNRYERDRRNRMAALAIHGWSCQTCGLRLSDVYGVSAGEVIHVHHTTPVSEIGPDYVINPEIDLIPLCPNCHAVVHSQEPMLQPDDVRNLIEETARKRSQP